MDNEFMPTPVIRRAPMSTASELQAELERSLAADPSLPGIMATVHAPRIGLSWSGACGQAMAGEPLSADHAFRVASITKPYTAAVALRLCEQGRLDLLAPITPWLEGNTRRHMLAAGYDPSRITCFHLMTHGSGLRDHTVVESGYGHAIVNGPARVWTHAEQIELCLSLGGPLSEPGTHFSYSDTAYVILGDLLERAGGLPLHVLMRELLHFERRGLVHTHFERHEAAPAGQRRAGQRYGGIDVATFDCSNDLSGGGGLISTTDELARFFRQACVGALFEHPQTLALALAMPSLLFTPPRDSLHAPLMRGRWIGDEPAWCHSGFWGAVAAYFPASDISLAVSHNQALAGASTLGVAGDRMRPSLADRLARVVQTAQRLQHHPLL
jgi:D-alanyl-D-alanine carboxypeptidase